MSRMSGPASSPKGFKPHITDSVLTGKRVIPGIPPNPLPTWVNLPLEAKLPMLPAPKGGVVLYTTDLGEKIHQSSQELGFDLTDPYSMLMSNDYKPLHDPHLKPHLKCPRMKKRLFRSGFITRDGKVLCTLREFNEYRQYLRQIGLRQEKEQQGGEQGSGHKVKSNRSSNSSSLIRQREEKVREIKKRLEKQHEEDRNRYAKLLAEDEERRRRIREEQMARLAERETYSRDQRDKRHASIKRHQLEDRARKLEQIQRWYENDRRRTLLAEKRRKIKEIERQKKLEQRWEERKKIQRMKLEKEARMREEQEELKQKSINERERLLKAQQKRQQEILQEMSAFRRQEKERLDAEYARKFEEKMRKRRSRQGPRKRRQRTGKRAPSRQSPLKSVWDLEKTLMETFPPNAEHGKVGELEFLQLVEEHLREQEEQQEIEKAVSQLGLDEFKGAQFSYEALRKLSDHRRASSSTKVKARVSQLGLGEFHGATFKVDVASDDEQFEEELVLSDEERSESPIATIATLGLSEFHGVKPSPSILDLVEKEKESKKKRKVAFQESTECHRYDRPRDPEEDLQAAARSIVHVTMELATKVIYPAYMKYLEEDYPELYAQYNRPTTPLPRYDDEEDEDSIEEHKARGVRFSMIDTSIPSYEVQDPIGWEPGDWSQFQEDSDEDDDQVPMGQRSSLMLRISGKDSVTRVRRRESCLEHQQEQPQDLDLMLEQIMGMLTGGGLDPQQVRHLAVFAKQLIDTIDQNNTVDSPVATPSPQMSLASVSPVVELPCRRSTTSALADFVVQETLQQLETELFALPRMELDWKETPPMSASSVSALADMLTNEAISRATLSLEELSSREIATESADVDVRTSGYLLRSSFSDEAEQLVSPARSNAGPSLSLAKLSSRGTSTESADVRPSGCLVRSSSSEEAEQLVSSTLAGVCQQLGRAEQPFRRPRSMTSMLVMETINKVAMELSQEQDAQVERATSMIVQETLEKVAAQIQENSKRSSTSLFVQEVLEKVAAELADTPGGVQLNWEEQRPLKSREECESSMSLLVRNTLSRVIQEMEEENKAPARKTASSAFAEELVADTLTKCLHEIKTGSMGRDQVMAFVGAALHSAKTLNWQVRRRPSSTSTKSLCILGRDSRFKSTNSLLVEALVRETLVSVHKDIAGGQITPEEITNLANAIEFNGKDDEGVALRTSESQEAESLVMRAIGSVLDDLGVESISFDGARTTVVKAESTEANKPPLSKKTSQTDDARGESSQHGQKRRGTLQRISDAVFGVFKRSSSQNTAARPKTAESELAESLVADALQANIEDIGKQGNLNQTTLYWENIGKVDRKEEQENSPSPMDAEKEQENSPSRSGSFEGTGIVSDTHIIALDHYESSDSEPEMEIHPVLNGEEIPVDSHLVGEALMAFSAREVSKLKEPRDAVGRYSYRDLFHPDISRVSGLHAENKDSLQHQLQTVSHRSVVLHSHLSPKDLEQALAEDEEELRDQEEEMLREKESLEEDLDTYEPIESVISVVDLSNNQSAQSQPGTASRTQSLDVAGETKKGSATRVVTKTATLSSSRKASAAALQQKRSGSLPDRPLAFSSSLQRSYGSTVASRTSLNKKPSVAGSSTSTVASRKGSKVAPAAKANSVNSRISLRPGASKTTSGNALSGKNESATVVPTGQAKDSQLTLLQQVADRLGESSRDDAKEMEVGAPPAQPQNSATQSFPQSVESTTKSATPCKDSSGSKESVQVKAGASDSAVKRKKSKGSGASIDRKRSQEEKVGTENPLSKKPSKEDTIKAYSSGSCSPTGKALRKRSSRLSAGKEQEKPVHSFDGVVPGDEGRASAGSEKEDDVRPNINNSSASLALRESSGDLAERDSCSSRDSRGEITEANATSGNVISKSSSSRKRLPPFLTQVTQIPELFAPVDPELLSDQGSLSSRGSQKSDISQRGLPTHVSATHNPLPSKCKISYCEDGYSRGSRGSMNSASVKTSFSETKTTGRRRSSRADAPHAQVSMTSIPKKMDSSGMLREEGIFSTASTASAPELMREQCSHVSLNSKAKRKVPPEGTPV